MPDLANISQVSQPQPPSIASLSASAATSQSIKLTANNVADTGGTVTSVTFYRESNNTPGLQTTGPTPDTAVGTATNGSWNVTVSGLSSAPYTFYAIATDNHALTSNVVSTSINVNTPAVLNQQGDIGSVGVAGSSSGGNGAYTVNGSGGDIWNSADAFHYVYTTLSGNGTIIARVSGVSNTNSWAKAGVMIRESTAAGSRQAMMVVTRGNGVAMQYRTTPTAKAPTQTLPAATPPTG